MNSLTMKNHLIKKIKTLSYEQLELVANLIHQLEQNFESEKIIEAEEKAIKKWEYLLEKDKKNEQYNSISNEEIVLIRQFFIRESKNLPLDLPKDDFFIADDFNAPLPDDIIDLFYQ